MKLFTPEATREIDKDASQKYGIASIILMENAGRGAAAVIEEKFPDSTTPVCIVAGPGNNGGDGFVIARHLNIAHYTNVKVVCVAPREKYRGDALANLEILERSGHKPVFASTPRQVKKELAGAQIVVDAIFGTGLNAPVEGFYAQVIQTINSVDASVVSVDIPSGISGRTGEVLGVAVRADITVTFAVPKVGLYVYPGRKYAGEIRICHIGIPSHVIDSYPSSTYAVTAELARSLLKPREPDAHKGTFGHVLLIGGSRGKCGALMLMGMGAAAAGAGLVTAMLPASEQPAVDAALPEVMTVPVGEDEDGMEYAEFIPLFKANSDGKDAVAVGPGLGVGESQREIVLTVISAGLPTVLDADALNVIRDDPAVLKRNRQCVITPHPGEMSRLCGLAVSEIQKDRIGVARAFAQEYKVITVLKGAGTVVAAPDGRVFVNTTGNHGMASGGMGDVLTGVIAGLLAQNYSPLEAAVLGVYLHALSADILAGCPPCHGYTASDVARGLKNAYASLHGSFP